jgi:hypothetical protein
MRCRRRSRFLRLRSGFRRRRRWFRVPHSPAFLEILADESSRRCCRQYWNLQSGNYLFLWFVKLSWIEEDRLVKNNVLFRSNLFLLRHLNTIDIG